MKALILTFATAFIAVACSCPNKKATAELPPAATAPSLSDKKAAGDLLHYYRVAHFFRSAMDESIRSDVKAKTVLKKTYCGIKPKEISLYSMQSKARIDQSWRIVSARPGALQALTEDTSCAAECSCGVFADLEEKVQEKQVQIDAKVLPDIKVRAALAIHPNSKTCAQQFQDFCKSSLFQEMQKDVHP